MADTTDLITRMRAARGQKGIPVPTPAAPAEDPENARARSADLLKSLGHDATTIQSVVPDVAAPPVDIRPDHTNLVAGLEASQHLQSAADDGMPIPERKLQDEFNAYLSRFGDVALSGLAATSKFVRRYTDAIGENVAKHALARPFIDAGMAGLDNMAYLSNWAKLALAPAEQRAVMRLTYLPTETLLDPKSPPFHTTMEMATWLAGQRAWGAANDLAALPADLVGKALDVLGLPEASAAAHDLAARDRATADRIDSFAAGQLPQLVAGKAPFLSWQKIFESHIPPAELDGIYAQLDDPGLHGPVTAAAAAGLFALADFYADPVVIASGIPAKLIETVPRAAQLSRVGREAVAEAAATTARRTFSYDDALSAVNAAKKITAKAEEAITAAAKAGGGVDASLYNDLLKAQKAQAREEAWLARFEDPGAYEPIMLRPARRNPEAVPKLKTETSYEFVPHERPPMIHTGMEPVEMADELAARGPDVANVRPTLKVTKQLVVDETDRVKTLREGAHTVVDWNDPKQMNMDLQVQRAEMGPSDAEYAGDALNMLVRGATVDDVSMASNLAPEYFILPDTKASLYDIRKATATGRLDDAATRVTKDPNQYGLAARDMLEADIEDAQTALRLAKSAKNKDLANEIRGKIRTMKKMKDRLPAEAETPFDPAWVPKKEPGIMDSPERFNSWLEKAGNRVIRSLYPGGLYVHGWDTKLGQAVGLGREPMRYYRTYAPQTWEKIRGGTLQFEAAIKSSSELLTRESEKAGMLVRREKFDMQRHFAPLKPHPEKANEVAKLLNTVAGTEKYEALRASMDPALVKAHDTFRRIYDHLADLQGLSATDRYLEGYFRHMWDKSLFANGARPVEFIGVPQKGNLMVSHLMERKGGEGYMMDAVLVTDLYLRAAYRKLFMEPVYKEIERTGIELAMKHGNNAHMSYANDLINQMKGKPSFLGAKVDDAISGVVNSGGGIQLPFTKRKLTYQPGALDRGIHGLWQALHTGLTFGPHYAVTQIAAGLSTSAGRFGSLSTMRGVFQFATKEGQQLGRVAGTYKPFVDYLTSNKFTSFMEAMQSRVKVPPLWISNGQAEEMTRGLTYNVALKHYLKKAGYETVKEAADAGFLKRIMFEALQDSERINHFYGPLGRTPWVTRFLGASGATGATLFLSYIPKQAEELASQIARNPGYILQYLAFSGHLVRMAARAGIDITQETGLGFIPQDMTDFTSPAVDAAITNLMLQDALAANDGPAVERYTEQLTRMLPGLVPGSQLLLKGGRAAERLKTGTVLTADGKPLFRMQMMGDEKSAIGGELAPTFLLQRDIRETLVRRGLEATSREKKRIQYNGQRALQDFIDAKERGDEEAAAKLADELANVYNIRLANPAQSVNSLIEARSMAYTLRNLKDNPQLMDIFWKTYQQNGVPVQP